MAVGVSLQRPVTSTCLKYMISAQLVLSNHYSFSCGEQILMKSTSTSLPIYGLTQRLLKLMEWLPLTSKGIGLAPKFTSVPWGNNSMNDLSSLFFSFTNETCLMTVPCHFWRSFLQISCWQSYCSTKFALYNYFAVLKGVYFY